jgi:hypothetical protein
MRVLLLQLDGKTPNLALCRIAAHHRRRGDEVELRHVSRPETVERGFWEDADKVYASLIFKRTRPLAERLKQIHGGARIGGTGWDETVTLASVGVSEDERPDFTDYPNYPHSIGFTQRGCRLKCEFCVVPTKEGDVKPVATCWDIWRGEPWPRNLLLLDNDFFGQKDWQARIEEIKSGGFRVCWNQGFNVRLIGEEEAAAIASTPYYDDQFAKRQLYTAWDNRKDEKRLFRNLEALVKHGVRADDIIVYMLVGFWDGARLTEDDFYRHKRLREFGCRPYPMPYVRVRELTDFQRWVVKAYDKNWSWQDFMRAKGRPEKLGAKEPEPDLFSVAS